jgi:hypothetical protein
MPGEAEKVMPAFDGIACTSDGQAILVKAPTMNDELRRIEQKLDEVLKMLKDMPTGAKPGFTPKTVTDADLDGKYGNPEVRMVPSKWTGQDYKGWKFSDCPAEFLDELAGMLEAIARKQAQDPVKAKYADWSSKDAAKARAWAERHRKNGGPVKGDPMPDDWNDTLGGDTKSDEFPF